MVKLVDMKSITNVESRACEHCQSILSPMQHGVVVTVDGKDHIFCCQRCADHFKYGHEKKQKSKMIVV